MLFNAQAESPSFVIAALGVALWGVSAPPPTAPRLAAAALAIALVSLPSSAVAPYWAWTLRARYHFKMVPCAIAWCAIEAELLGARRGSGAAPRPAPAAARRTRPSGRSSSAARAEDGDAGGYLGS